MEARKWASQLQWARAISWGVFSILALGSSWHEGWSRSGAINVALVSMAVAGVAVEVTEKRWKLDRLTSHRGLLLFNWTGSLLSYAAVTGLIVIDGRTVQIAGCAFLMWNIVSRRMIATESDHALLELTFLWVALAAGWLIRTNDTSLVAIVALGSVGSVLALAVRQFDLEKLRERSSVATKVEMPPYEANPTEASWAEHDSVLHDLSNAMTASLFMVRDLSRALDKGTEPSLGRARSLSQALVRELSEISEHIKSTRQSVRVQPIAGALVQLLEPIGCIIELVSNSYPSCNCRLECEAPAKNAKVSIIGGEATLKRIIENLVINACQAQPGASRSIEVAFQLSQIEGAVSLTVEDNGPGFPTVILDSFPSPSLSTKPQGTGIGLYSCHQLVKRDGGKMVLSNTSAGGARVLITWPMPSMMASIAAADESQISISGTRVIPNRVIPDPPQTASKR